MSPPIYFHLFAGPRFEVEGRLAHVSGQAAAAAAILALHGPAGVRPSSLIHLLWDHGKERSLRNRLKQTLYDLRQRLHERSVVTYRKGRYVLDPSLVHDDLEDFRQLLRDEQLVEALTLLERGLLSGLGQAPSDAFSEWILKREADLTDQLAECAATTWEACSSSGRWTDASRAAEVLCRIFPTRQRYLRMVLSAEAAAGRILRARTFLDRHTRRMRLAYPQWKPDKDTQLLFGQLDQLGRRHIGRAKASKKSVPVLPVVGRAEELRRLSTLLAAPPDSMIQGILISGPQGCGKSRLMQEVLAASADAGIVILHARALPSARNRTYSTLHGLLAGSRPSLLPYAAKHLLGSPLEPLRRLRLDSKALQVPSWRSHLSSLQERLKSWVIGEVEQGRHIVFAIDDADWIDPDSADLLSTLFEHWSIGGVSFLCSTRVARNLNLAFPNEEGDPWVRLRLDPLPPEDIGDLVDRYVARLDDWKELDPKSVRRLAVVVSKIAGGDLHWLLSFLSDLLSNVGAEVEGERAVPRPALEALRALLRDRLRRLSTDAASILQYCVCLGRPVSIAGLKRVTQMDELHIAQEVTMLSEKGFLDFQQDRVVVGHPVIRRHLYDETPEPVRVVVHERIADRLLDGESRLSLAEAGHHLLSAGRIKDASQLALQAAEGTHSEGKLSQVIRILRETSVQCPDADQRLQGLLRLGELLAITGDARGARDAFRRAHTLAQALGDPHSEHRAQLGRLRIDIVASKAVGRESLEEVVDLRSHVIAAGTTDLLPKLFELELRGHARLGNHDAIHAVLNHLPEVERMAAPAVAAELKALGSLGSIYGDLEAGKALAHEVLSSLRVGDDPELELRALNWLIILGIQEGSLQATEGLSLRRRAAQAAQRTGEILEQAKLESNNAVWFLDIGDLEGAEAALRRAKRFATTYSVPEVYPHVLVNAGELSLRRRNYQSALEHFGHVVDLTRTHPCQPAHLYARAGVTVARLGLGQRRVAHSSSPCLGHTPALLPFDFSLLTIAEARSLLSQGRRAEAMDSLEDAAATLRSRFRLGWVRIVLEGLRFGEKGLVSLDEVEDFLHERHLTGLLRQLRSLMRRVT